MTEIVPKGKSISFGFLRLLLQDFGPLLIFFALNNEFGVRVALTGSMIFGVGLIGALIIRKKNVPTFLIFATLCSLVFGTIDVYSGSVFFVKFESVVTNLFTAAFFSWSLFGSRTPIIQEFALRTDPTLEENLDDALKFYFRILTWVWIGYFVLKSAVYLWVGLYYSLEAGIAFRTVFGNITMWSLLGVTMVFGRQLFDLFDRLGLLPAEKIADNVESGPTEP
jgi:intracellular septation protein A